MAKENIVIIKYSIVLIFPKGFSCSFCKDTPLLPFVQLFP